jgi:aspartyl-tRNA(Asn)/glutamyl-tRNA(Gln) amidotransferase subunit A
LVEVGTVMLGKLANSEFAMEGSFDLPWPPPKNPWNLDRATGGSSSGTGAAVPMAWTTEDCAFLLQAMAGHDSSDPASGNNPCRTSVRDWT